MRLSKHHGQGNDFLVLLDLDASCPLGPESISLLCDRHRGIGADGLIRVLRPSDDASRSRPYEISCAMELFNADGSRAEMSGNGIRCLGQVLWDVGMVSGDVALVETDAGVRRLVLHALPRPGVASISVAMGEVRLGDEISAGELGWMDERDRLAIRRAVTAEVGNPHLVLLVSKLDEVDLLRVGRAAQHSHSGGVNVEVIVVDERESPEVNMVVYERGVGPTLACGTGSCAVAAVARTWDLVAGEVEVRNPGGLLSVDFEDGEAILKGDVVHVADVEVSRSLLGST